MSDGTTQPLVDYAFCVYIVGSGILGAIIGGIVSCAWLYATEFWRAWRKQRRELDAAAAQWLERGMRRASRDGLIDDFIMRAAYEDDTHRRRVARFNAVCQGDVRDDVQ